MSLSLAITPGGVLQIVSDPESLPTVSLRAAERLRREFARSSGYGLLLLASQEVSEERSPTLVFWRSFARRLMHSLCQLGEEGFSQWKGIAPPEEEALAQLIAEAPPMRGLEYLTADLMRRLWGELRERVVADAASCSAGPAGFLHSVNPLWHLVGPEADTALGDQNLAELFGIDLEVAPKRSGRPRKAAPSAPAPEGAKRAAKSAAGRSGRGQSKLQPKGARRGAAKSAAEPRPPSTAKSARKITAQKRETARSVSAASRARQAARKDPRAH